MSGPTLSQRAHFPARARRSGRAGRCRGAVPGWYRVCFRWENGHADEVEGSRGLRRAAVHQNRFLGEHRRIRRDRARAPPDSPRPSTCWSMTDQTTSHVILVYTPTSIYTRARISKGSEGRIGGDMFRKTNWRRLVPLVTACLLIGVTPRSGPRLPTVRAAG